MPPGQGYGLAPTLSRVADPLTAGALLGAKRTAKGPQNPQYPQKAAGPGILRIVRILRTPQRLHSGLTSKLGDAGRPGPERPSGGGSGRM